MCNVFWHAFLCVNYLFHCSLLSFAALKDLSSHDATTNWKDKAAVSHVHISSSDDDDDDDDYDSDNMVDERDKIHDPYDPFSPWGCFIRAMLYSCLSWEFFYEN